ncbi:efflux RND transporter permease subunit [Cohnella sp.]|uniref:efflux RND transporter permease subunit n=1 Tax=Cohnella sp. TaxID=1883426 RepID=UPI00356157EE
MKAIIDFSMNKVAAMVIMIVIVFGAGAYSGSSLKVENMPEFSFPFVAISTTYQASPQDVMSQVTKPIEDKVANIAGLRMLSSTSSDNFSSIFLQFNEKVNIDKTKQDLESLVQDVSLPQSASRPKVSTFGMSSEPVYYMAMHATGSMSQTELDQLFEKEMKPRFEAINGIDHMDAIGARKSSLDIQLDAGALAAYQLSPSKVNASIQAAMANGSVGVVKFNGNTQMTRVAGKLESLYELKNLEIATPAGTMVQLKDISKIEAVNESNFIARLDDKPAIGIHLYKTAAANAVEFSDAVQALIREWEQTNPKATFKTLYDSASEVKGSIKGLVKEGFLGIVLAALMILFFLRNLRMTLIVVVSIPLSILMTLVMMKYMNITLNIMSLGGMFIAVGRVVDDSIVVIESIYANLQKAQKRNESVVILAVKQVAMAISSSTLVTVGVFLPIGLVSGFIGALFRPFAITVSIALLASLLVSLTVIPMLAKLMVLNNVKATEAKEHEGGRMVAWYEKALVWSLNHRTVTLLLSGFMLVATIAGTVPVLPKGLLPYSPPPKQMNYSIQLPNDTTFASNDLQAKQIEALLRDAKDENDEPQFMFVEALVGYAGNAKERFPSYLQIITEVRSDADTKVVQDRYHKLILAQLPKGSEVMPGSFSGGSSGPAGPDFTYVIFGDDQKTLKQVAGQIKDKMKQFPELREIKDNLGDGKKEVQITVDPNKAGQFGLEVTTIQGLTAEWIGRSQLGDVRLDNTLYQAAVELAPEDKNSMEQLGQMPIQTADGSIVYLNEVAKLEETDAPTAFERESQKLMVALTAKIDSADKAAISNAVMNAIREVEFPPGVTNTTRGANIDMMEGFKEMFVAMGAAVAIVYLIMVLCFGNAGTPFAILFSLPLAIIGGLLGLVVAGESLNMTSMIGFLMLIGIVVTNAIVLLDRAQQLRKEGYLVRQALIEAGKVRLRPIIMTAGATIAAMVPLTLGLTKGLLISKSLAVVVIGGLITSTILTLVVVPIIYEMIESFKARMKRLFNRKGKISPEHEIGV